MRKKLWLGGFLSAILAILSVAVLATESKIKTQSDLATYLNREIAHLEYLKEEGRISDDQSEKLAQLYVLTSRCNEVSGLQKAGAAVVCACGGSCALDDRRKKVLQLRSLASEHGFSDPKVQALWVEVKDFPEAWYWVSKILEKEKKNLSLLFELQRKLDALELR
ncbi:MAG: hypothetical protein AB7F43_05505 [Bacteriovoracia bacterium]